MTSAALAPAPAEQPRYTPDNHPLRDVKPEPWMTRNARALAENLSRIAFDAALDLSPSRKEANNG